MSLNRKLAAAIAAVCMVLSGLAMAVPAAAAAGSLVEEIEVRDRLIADQEALLNAYRCMFALDVAAVPGGCANGAPAQPGGEPGPPPPNPTKADKDARDNLIAGQEHLLNAYRCNHNIDTQLAPGGCPEPVGDDVPIDDPVDGTSEAEEDNTDQNTDATNVEVTPVFDSEGNLCTTDWGLRVDGQCYSEDERNGWCIRDDYGYLPPGFTPRYIILDFDTGDCILYGYVFAVDDGGYTCPTFFGVRPDGICYSYAEYLGRCSDTPTNLIYDYSTGECVWYEPGGDYS